MDTMTWEEPLAQQMKVERNLNFSTIANEDDEFGFSRKKPARDPMSHRIIEKRRRDRMNNCLADLSRLVPTNYLKKGRGRIEKTEIIEMAIRHLKHLQSHPCKDPANCEVAKNSEMDYKRHFKSGYTECLNEALRYVGDLQGIFTAEIIERMTSHLTKHYEKLSGSSCYTKTLEMMSNEDSKTGIHMDIDNHSNSSFPPESGINPPMNCQLYNFTYEQRNSETLELKKEVDHNGHNQNQLPIIPVKVTSQLREMLQNPGVPVKDSMKNTHFNSNGNSTLSSLPTSQPISVVVPVDHHVDNPKQEEGYYKFKNNIKHRFNNDIRHHTSSPTDSHLSDRMSLPDEDHNNNKLHVPDPYPIRSFNSTQNPEERLVPIGLCNGSSPTRHAFSPYPSNRVASELSVKIPERPENSVLSSSYATQHWDSHAETGSSCGSSASPPLNASRSNGSSSGYSTNGENNTLKMHSGAHSPTLSPYSRTPDRLSNRSPSPLETGVPIFALHPKGSFYIPLTIDSAILIPYLAGLDEITPVLHPISICVNLSNNSVKVEKNNDSMYRAPTSFIMSKYQERYVVPERPLYYPCSTSPIKNGCS